MPLETPTELAVARDAIATMAEERRRLIARAPDRARRREILKLDTDLSAIVGELVTRIDPCDASAEVPLVLLPVRVETKLVPGTRTLRIRISPDELHIDSLLRAVTAAESDAGRTYWNALWTDASSATAWPALREAVGDRRAGWVAEATTPTNLPALGQGEPMFPESPGEVAQGTVARCLPDQFVVRVFPDGAEAITIRGAAIARDVPLSPIAFGDDELSEVGGLRVPIGSEWTVDFEKAKAAGLGVEVMLPAGVTVIRRIVVVGARRSVSEEENAADFADLLTSHRFTDGFSLLAPGTATNNADAERSPYRTAASAGAPATAPRTPSEGASNVAVSLGLDPASVEHLLDPTDPVSSLSTTEKAVNTALWFATWDPVLARFDDAEIPGVTPASIESARRLHRDHVRGSGPAPALRVGAQPYGILPITDLEAWSPRSGEITAQLVPLIRRTLLRWNSRSRVLPRVRPGDELSDAALLEMMGLSPVATGVRARPAVDGPQLSTFAAATGADAETLLAESQVHQAVLAQFSIDAAKILKPPSPHDESRTIGLPLVSPRDAEVVAQILADALPQVDSVVQALLAIAWDEVKRYRFRSAPQEFVSPLLQLVGLDAELTSMVLQASGSDGRLDADPEVFFAAAAKIQSVKHFDGQPAERVSIAAIEPVPEARTSLAQVALDLGDTVEAKWIGSSAISDLLYTYGMASELRAAMTTLAAAPLEERRIAVAQAIDTAAHRVDAWATALAMSRRTGLAAANPTGMTIGAFGYVEEIRLGVARDGAEGWIHAPSSSHAVAAGVLASANRSNIGAVAGARPFAIDLSSRRGVELRRVLEGVQAGQSVGALLGYQIERALTGSATRFQLSLREIAPMNVDELGNDLAQDVAASRVAAADVVDGADLLRLFPLQSLEGGDPPLRTRLAEKPKHGFIEAWGPVTEPEWSSVTRAIRDAAATLDAISDALLSESVLQYASGNPSRASAAMDAMGSGAAVDPELSVLSVRQTGRILTHGLFAGIPSAAAGWSSTRPRAIAEPRLEAWAARRLGDPADVIVAEVGGTRHTLAEAGFAALDLVFTDDVASLDRELRAAIPALGDSPLAATRAAEWPEGAQSILGVAALAGSLRSLVAGAAALAPDDLVRTGERPQRSVDTNELMARCDGVLDGLQATIDSGATVIAAIDPDTLAVEESEVADVIAAVQGLAAFGVPLVADAEIPSNVAWARGAWQAASARLIHARAALAVLRNPGRDPAASTTEIVDACGAVAEGVLGDGFLLLPLLTPTQGSGTDALLQALREPLLPQPAQSRINAFVRDHATVKAGVGRLAEAQLLGSALGRPVPLRVAQLTERDEAGSAAPGTDRWLAGSLPDDIPWPGSPATHLIVELVGADDDFAGPFAGLVFDGWPETLPFQPDARALDPAAPENPLRAARATTGLAVHANQASARAPQVILSAISADGRRWTIDSVVKAVLESVDLAKGRLVTYEHAPGDAAILPAIYVASPWLQIRKGLSFTELAKTAWSVESMPFLSEVK